MVNRLPAASNSRDASISQLNLISLVFASFIEKKAVFSACWMLGAFWPHCGGGQVIASTLDVVQFSVTLNGLSRTA